ncbi:MAG: hypothetical protein KA327_11875, partial [Pseudarcicella sp.]|nr:hypothetical protein [Pseudarcicella sp.]
IWNPQIVRLKIEAKKINRDTLEFTFPQNFTVPEPSFLTIETTSPANTEKDEEIQTKQNTFLKIIYSKPTAKISDLFKSKELSIPESVNIPFNFTGGFPVEYGYSINNKKFTNSSKDSISNQYAYINTTSNIKLDYVKNACGLGVVSDKVVIISIKDLKPDTALKVSFLALEKNRYCYGEKIPVKFEVKNNTEPKQSFNLMVRNYNYYQWEKAFENITENTIIDASDFLKEGTHELMLISTKNPNFTSETIRIEIDTKPSASLTYNYYDNTTNTFIKGTPVILYQYVSGTPPFKITYSDNSDTILNSNSNSQKIIYPIKDGEIFIKSISNACGINTNVSNTKLSYKIKPFLVENFRIENLPKINSSYDSPIMCRKKKYTFLFDVIGEIPKDSSLYLKIGTTQFNNYQEFTIFDKIVQKNIQTSFSFQVPDSLVNGHYVFMIDDKPETVTIKGYNNSSLVHVKIIDTPQIHLGLMNLKKYYDYEYYYYNYDNNKLIDYKTSKPKQDTTIHANENVAMGFYDKSNVSNIYNIYVNAVVEATDLVTNTKTYSYHNQSNQFLSVNPQNNTTYKIIKTSNECGVGTGEGEVKVTTSPNVKIDHEYYKTKGLMQSSSVYYDPQVCFGKSAQFRIKNYSNNSPNEKIQLYLNIFSKSNNKEKIYLGDFTAKDSIITLNIPERKPEEIEAYSVSIVNMNLGINKVLIQNLNLKGKPNLVLLGNAVINQGDSTNLFVSNLYSSVQYFNYTNYLEYSKDTLHIEWNDNHKSVSSNNGASRIVKPSTTTEYSIKNSSNECGVGVANGKITITVNPPSERQIFFDKTQINVSSDSLRLNDNYYNENAPLCKNSKMYVQFLTKGTFTKNNVFTVEVADKDGKNFKSLKTKSFKNGLVADIPNDILSNEYLLLKIVASDPNTTSTTTQFIVKNTIKAYFQSQFYTQENGKTKNLKIVLENIPGHNYYNYVKVNLLELTKGQEIKEIYLKDEVTELKLPFNETNEYRILNGYDYDQYYYNGWYGNEYYPNRGITIGCPLEIISPKTAKYQIEQITANEKEEKLSVNVFPNPTTDKINIETDGSPFSVQIFG